MLRRYNRYVMMLFKTVELHGTKFEILQQGDLCQWWGQDLLEGHGLLMWHFLMIFHVYFPFTPYLQDNILLSYLLEDHSAIIGMRNRHLQDVGPLCFSGKGSVNAFSLSEKLWVWSSHVKLHLLIITCLAMVWSVWMVCVKGCQKKWWSSLLEHPCMWMWTVLLLLCLMKESGAIIKIKFYNTIWSP